LRARHGTWCKVKWGGRAGYAHISHFRARQGPCYCIADICKVIMMSNFAMARAVRFHGRSIYTIWNRPLGGRSSRSSHSSSNLSSHAPKTSIYSTLACPRAGTLACLSINLASPNSTRPAGPVPNHSPLHTPITHPLSFPPQTPPQPSTHSTDSPPPPPRLSLY